MKKRKHPGAVRRVSVPKVRALSKRPGLPLWMAKFGMRRPVNMALLNNGERLGKLEIVALVSRPEDEEERYRVKCLQCRSDSVLCNAGALLAGRVKLCYDCAEQSRLTPQQRTVIAFRRGLQMSPEPLPIGWVA